MTEDAKRAVIAKVQALLDENDRIRVVETTSVQRTFPAEERLIAFREGRERYLLIAIGEELDTERMAIRLLGSIVMSKTERR